MFSLAVLINMVSGILEFIMTCLVICCCIKYLRTGKARDAARREEEEDASL